MATEQDELQRIIKALNDAQVRYEGGAINEIGYARALRKQSDLLARYLFDHMMSYME
jgi:hypothetical protein